jgi:hypothetical protein
VIELIVGAPGSAAGVALIRVPELGEFPAAFLAITSRKYVSPLSREEIVHERFTVVQLWTTDPPVLTLKALAT